MDAKDGGLSWINDQAIHRFWIIPGLRRPTRARVPCCYDGTTVHVCTEEPEYRTRERKSLLLHLTGSDWASLWITLVKSISDSHSCHFIYEHHEVVPVFSRMQYEKDRLCLLGYFFCVRHWLVLLKRTLASEKDRIANIIVTSSPAMLHCLFLLTHVLQSYTHFFFFLAQPLIVTVNSVTYPTLGHIHTMNLNVSVTAEISP